MRRLAMLFVLLLAGLSGSAGAGIDPFATRQSAGIFVTRDGMVHTVYLDFEAAEFRSGPSTAFPVTLNTDLDLWIEGHQVPAGLYEWTLDVAADGKWTIGEPAGPRKPGAPAPRRFLLSVAEGGRPSRWLTASFAPDPGTASIQLFLRFGENEGMLRLALREGVAADAGPARIDVFALRGMRDRLRSIAGAIDARGNGRFAWSGLLGDLGGELVKAGAWAESFDLDRTDERVALVLKGGFTGERGAVDALPETLSRGAAGSVFQTVGKPIARRLPKGPGWTFEMTAESDRATFDRFLPVAALADGEQAARLAEEVLLLEERIGRMCAGAVRDLSAAQTLLLAAKRESGAIISRIDPGETQPGPTGLSVWPVRITITGPGAALVLFVRALEELDVPLRLVPLKLSQGDLAAEMVLSVEFLDYRRLSDRDPGLFDSIRALGMGPEFDRKRDLYLAGADAGASRPFRRPDWPRDPFTPPTE